MKRGFFVGFFLSFKRILRCNPYSAGGYDPVPEKKTAHKKSPKYQKDTANTETTEEEQTTQRANDDSV